MAFIPGKGDCIVIHALFPSAPSGVIPRRNAMTAPAPTARDSLTWRAGLYVVLGGLCVTALSVAIVAGTPFTGGFVLGALAPYLAGGLIVVARIAAFHPFPRFGAANALTLSRLVLCALIGGLAFEVAVGGARPDAWLAWSFYVLAGLGMVIDGLDGYAARRDGMMSAFGARFDMEVDALQILLLCVVAIALGKAGLWVLLGGALRYFYELGAVFWPALRRPLPPSFRRKLISVVQGGALSVLLAPIVTPPISTAIAAAALLLLIYSFAVDVIWCARDARRERQTT